MHNNDAADFIKVSLIHRELKLADAIIPSSLRCKTRPVYAWGTGKGLLLNHQISR
jgi:hypothetical protein